MRWEQVTPPIPNDTSPFAALKALNSNSLSEISNAMVPPPLDYHEVGTIRLVSGTPDGQFSPRRHGQTEVVLCNIELGTRTIISQGLGGVTGNGSSFFPTISIWGNWVSFGSMASNLVEGDTNATTDTFVYETAPGNISRVSQSSQGLEGDATSYPYGRGNIAHLGEYSTFISMAENLVPEDSNSEMDIFFRNRKTGETKMLPRPEGMENAWSTRPAISTSGHWVSFDAMVNGYRQIYIYHAR